MSVHFCIATNSPLPQEALFRRSLSIDDHLESMAASGERAVAGVTSGLIGEGQTVTWRARHFGVPFRMTSLVEEVGYPHRFVDRQIKGPFAAFRHVHTFEPAGTGTTMVDDITFAAPFGLLGLAVERLILGPYLRRLITQRNEFLCRPL